MHVLSVRKIRIEGEGSEVLHSLQWLEQEVSQSYSFCDVIWSIFMLVPLVWMHKATKSMDWYHYIMTASIRVTTKYTSIEPAMGCEAGPTLNRI